MASMYGAEHGLKRFVGFTDAVFAIALTLLFVEITPPGSPDGPPVAVDAARAVAEQWRDHLALIVSFLGIGIYWLQHYYSDHLYAKSDHVFGLINLGFLFGIGALPYPARLWAFHLGSAGEAEASAILAAGLLLPSLFWLMKWFYASRHSRLIDRRLAPDYISQMTRRFLAGTAVLALAVPIALIAPRLGLALSFIATAYWILPQPRPRIAKLSGIDPTASAAPCADAPETQENSYPRRSERQGPLACRPSITLLPLLKKRNKMILTLVPRD